MRCHAGRAKHGVRARGARNPFRRFALESFALLRVVIPNRKIVGDILHNSGNIRQRDIAVGVAYDSDMNAAVAAINEVLAANPRVLKDPPPVFSQSSSEIGPLTSACARGCWCRTTLPRRAKSMARFWNRSATAASSCRFRSAR